MRPSFQRAPGTPCSAAYSSSSTAWSVLPWRSACVPDRNASNGVAGPIERGGTIGVTGTETSGVALPSGLISGVDGPAALGMGTTSGLPSKLTAGQSPKSSAKSPMLRRTSDVRIARLLCSGARMRDGTEAGRANLLRVLEQVAGGELRLGALPCFGALRQLGLADLNLEGAGDRVDRNDVAVAYVRDRSADGSFGPHMADAESARGAGETSVGDQ